MKQHQLVPTFLALRSVEHRPWWRCVDCGRSWPFLLTDQELAEDECQGDER